VHQQKDLYHIIVGKHLDNTKRYNVNLHVLIECNVYNVTPKRSLNRLKLALGHNVLELLVRHRPELLDRIDSRPNILVHRKNVRFVKKKKKMLLICFLFTEENRFIIRVRLYCLITFNYRQNNVEIRLKFARLRSANLLICCNSFVFRNSPI